MIYVGRRYTSRFTGSAVKAVACEKCGRPYSYRVTRQGVGQGSSPYYLDNSGAARRAEERARASVTRKLENAREIVPCPSCGWVQRDMVAEGRRRRHRWMIYLGVTGSFLGAIAFAIVSGAGRYGEDNTAAQVLTVLFGLAALALIPLRVFLNSQYDPNAGNDLGGTPGTARPIQPVLSAAPVMTATGSYGNAGYAPAAAAPLEAADWYCTLDGQQAGPMSTQQLQGLIAAGRLGPADYVWRNGMANWAPAGSVPGLLRM